MNRTVAAVIAWLFVIATAQADDPLPSWNDGPAKQAILNFVGRATSKDSESFVPPAERIAVFDNDGTLWCEQPMYVQAAFTFDRIHTLAAQHPEWKTTQPFKSVLEADHRALADLGERGLAELVMTTHASMTTAEFEQIVLDWIKTARHPKFKRPYTELVYQPMLEVINLLQAKGFKTYIVSGGGIEFMRPWTSKVYNIPPEQVIGSSIKTKYEMRPTGPVLMRLPEINFIDDKGGKPVGIGQFIGRPPLAAFGNSTGDQQMLEWTQVTPGAHLMMLVHHDDAEREYAYGKDSIIGTFSDELMAEVRKRKWTVISMRRDWKKIFAFQP
ncbi:MAG: HAD family hydrolase [Planctomycetota bacterium]|nr:HAD family hydrolase [Planctomycetota bacterium]